MTQYKTTYKNPTKGTPLITAICSGCTTPVLQVKFCCLVKPFYYPNSPNIPRYSVTLRADPIEDKRFIEGIQLIEKNEKVDSIIKNEVIKVDGESQMTGKVLIKFQSKDKIPVQRVSKKDPTDISDIELEDEFAENEMVMITYDILRYTKKNTMKTEHGLSFKPHFIFYYPEEEKEVKDGEG